MEKSTISKDIDSLVVQFNSLKEQRTSLRNQLIAALNVAVKEAFENCPNVTKIEWVQYCPNFNDGDKCEFSVHDIGIYFDSAMVVKASMSPSRLVDYKGNGYSNDQLPEGKYGEGWGFGCLLKNSAVYFAIYPIFAILNNFSNDDYETAWGDGVQVTISKDGVKTKRYNHD